MIAGNMGTTQKKITQSQVAKAAEVSQGIVSHVLTGSGSGALNVSEATRERIIRVAQELGYEIPSVEVRLRQRGQVENPRKKVLLVENSRTNEKSAPELKTSYHNLLGEIVAVTAEELSERDIACEVYYLKDEESFRHYLLSGGIDGVIWHASDTNRGLLQWIASRYPMVMLNRNSQIFAPYDSVSVDQEANISLAMNHLWSLGHTRIATFGHKPGESLFGRRIDAYKQFVSGYGLRDYHEFQALPDEQTRLSEEKVQMILGLWKDLGEDAPTAIILSDVFAVPLLVKAQQIGIRIPEDLSVVGIDNTQVASMMTPALSSMDESFGDMCRTAVERVAYRMEHPDSPSQKILISPRLIERTSVRDMRSSAEASLQHTLA